LVTDKKNRSDHTARKRQFEGPKSNAGIPSVNQRGKRRLHAMKRDCPEFWVKPPLNDEQTKREYLIRKLGGKKGGNSNSAKGGRISFRRRRFDKVLKKKGKIDPENVEDPEGG